MHAVDQILALIGQYGYLVVLLGVMAESAGAPIPGETILIAAGVLAHQGTLDLTNAIAFGVIGAVVGDQIGYWAGRKGGRPFVLRWGRRVGITPEHLARSERFFARHGGKAVFMARFVGILRVFGALTAGVSRMRWGTFLLYNVLGGAVWATAAVLAGYLLGRSIGLAQRWAGRASILLLVLLALGVTLYLAYRWVRDHPELLGQTADRLGGGRLGMFLRSRAGLWLRRRFSPGEAYGLVLTVGLALIALFSWAFNGLVEYLLEQQPLLRMDLAVLRFFHSHAEPALTTAVVALEAVFSPEVLLPAAALSGFLLVLRARRRKDFESGFSGAVLLAAASGTAALATLPKFLFHRPRPPASLQLAHEAGYGFPSSHAMTALVLGAAVFYLFALRPPESRWGSWPAKVRAGFVVGATVLMVGLGRVYEGAHYPSDVLAGWALGGIWASVCLTAAEILRRLHAEGRISRESYLRTGVKYAQFSLVGASNALVDLGTLNLLLLIEPTRNPELLVLYNLAALVATNANSYLWNTLWTFRHRAHHDLRQVGMFALQAAFSIVVGSLVLWLVAQWLVAYTDLSPFLGGNLAKMVSMMTGSTVSFLLMRLVVFRGEKA